MRWSSTSSCLLDIRVFSSCLARFCAKEVFFASAWAIRADSNRGSLPDKPPLLRNMVAIAGSFSRIASAVYHQSQLEEEEKESDCADSNIWLQVSASSTILHTAIDLNDYHSRIILSILSHLIYSPSSGVEQLRSSGLILIPGMLTRKSITLSLLQEAARCNAEQDTKWHVEC